jgi:hypothetical protein
LGKPEWNTLFQEDSCRPIVLGFNNGRKSQLHSEPYFAPGIMLWDRTWFSNKERLVLTFDAFTAGLKTGSGWHGCPRHCNAPANNEAFWKKKLNGNARFNLHKTL